MKYIIIAGAVILAIFLLVLTQIPLGIEPLTEMYFENHTSLPKYLFLNNPDNFSFTVHNWEYQKMRYLYTVAFYDENDNFLYNIDSGEIILENNESKTIPEQLTMYNHFQRTKVLVNIEKDLSLETPDFKNKLWWHDPNYPMQIDIHFWIEEKI